MVRDVRQVRVAPVSKVLFVAVMLAGVLVTQRLAATGPLSVDLSKYVRIGRYDLPEPTRTAAPPNSLLAQEASGVTYNWTTNTLFVVGDGGTSVVQVSKTGALIDSMTLAPAAVRRARSSTTPRASPTSAAACSS
jgi:uncharacterized protein YjiK